MVLPSKRRSQQRFQATPPEADRDIIVVTIKCPECATWRTYRVGLQLGALFNRELTSFGILVTCEECERDIDVGIGWVPDQGKGSKQVECAVGAGFGYVSDVAGLRSS